jgi:hypothetical protein
LDLLARRKAGRPQKPIHAQLLSELQRHVGAGDLFCPLSDAAFLELLKQTVPESRSATAEVVDELSMGVALCGEQERMGTEIYYLLNQERCKSPFPPISHAVWLRLAYILGMTYPAETPFPPHVERVMQKAFTDHLWSMRLTDMVNVLNGSVPPGNYDEVAQRLNSSNTAHSDEVKDFGSTYLSEIAGSLDLFAGTATDVIESQMRAAGATSAELAPDRRGERERAAHTILVNVARAGKGAQAFPTLHAHAKCLAAIRRDKRRKLSGNDLVDFHHAIAATVYCDAFFTEGPLRILLTSEPVKLDAEFGCSVISEETAALEYLRAFR